MVTVRITPKGPDQRPRITEVDTPLTFVLESGNEGAACRLILAHGAGAGVASAFFETVTELIVARGLAVTRFEFAYMAARRSGGPRRPPQRAEVLTSEYRKIVEQVVRSKPRSQKLLIGGKSLGGRVASLIAEKFYKRGDISGLICLGYPFHPPGEPTQLRTAHLEELSCPALVIQGERDPFGNKSEVTDFKLSKAIALEWIADGDHDLKPHARPGRTHKANLEAAADAIAAFAARLPQAR